MRHLALALTVVPPACGTEDAAHSPATLRVVSITLDADLSGTMLPAPPGTFWATVDVELRNDTGGDLPLSFAAFRIINVSGIATDAHAASEVLDDGCRTGSFLITDAEASCLLAFALADDDVPASIIYQDFDGDPRVTADVDVCPAERPDLCGRTCVDLLSDEDNCGKCGERTALECLAGKPACRDLTECDGSCVDITTDPNHCGGCDRPVAANATCSEGTEVCNSGYEDCGDGVCRDLDSDDAHCGACNAPVPEGTRCQNGKPACEDADLAVCDGTCTDLRTDLDNCGGCGLQCPVPPNDGYDLSCGPGQVCAITFPTPGGTCETQCEFNGWNCAYQGGYCVCDGEFIPGTCDCRCTTPLVGP